MAQVADGELVLLVARVHRPDPAGPFTVRILSPGSAGGRGFNQLRVAEEAIYCRFEDERLASRAPLDWR